MCTSDSTISGNPLVQMDISLHKQDVIVTREKYTWQVRQSKIWEYIVQSVKSESRVAQGKLGRDFFFLS